MVGAGRHRFVALLRAVNVGGKRPVAMAELRQALGAAGLENVRTYLQSGNAVFDSTDDVALDLAESIERVLHEKMSLGAEPLVLDCAGLHRIVTRNPFGHQASEEPRSVHVVFLYGPIASEAFDALQLPVGPGERALLGDGVVYLHLPHGYGRSKLTGAYFERALATKVTARNWPTVCALEALCRAE